MKGIPEGLNDTGRADWLADGYAHATLREREEAENDAPSGCDCSAHGLCLRHRRAQEAAEAQLAENAVRAQLLADDQARAAAAAERGDRW